MTKLKRVIHAWGRILSGYAPLLSIEITRECPLSCPGCYAYGDDHLGGATTLRELADLRGQALIDGVLGLVRQHRALHVSIVGGEPLIRHRELSVILPRLSAMGIHALVVTSGIIPIPAEWNRLPGVTVAVSVDGLREDHDRRRKPATYDRILKNIEGRRVDIAWVVTAQMMKRPAYLDEYLDFWTSRKQIRKVWLSIYTPQVGESSEEMLTPDQRRELIGRLAELKRRYPMLKTGGPVARAFADPPTNPSECEFSKMSVNYSADLRTRVEPCFFGGQPDCSQCGCAVSGVLHWVGDRRLLGPLKARHIMNASTAVGAWADRLRGRRLAGPRWLGSAAPRPAAAPDGLVRIGEAERS